MYETPIPLVVPACCPGCNEPRSKDRLGTLGGVCDVTIWDDNFNDGKGGYARVIGWVSCHDHIFGTVIDSFDDDGKSIWVPRPHPWSVEHVYCTKLSGRKIDDFSTCRLEIEILTREEFEAKYPLRRAN